MVTLLNTPLPHASASITEENQEKSKPNTEIGGESTTPVFVVSFQIAK